ncbi:transcription antitermination factor NusB [Candidatus Gracilibacteria bacterium]|nr:transcription antitermination factor NusB [Candidatus Gracilibacteria bacterium]
MASNRHIAREAVMQTIFAHEFRKEASPLDTLKYVAKEFFPKLTDMVFAEELLKGVLEKRDFLFDVIKQEAPQWPIDRIAPIDRAILEIGCYEILFSKDVPPVVAINEGVEVAKSYGDLNSAKFINGVLSTVMHKYKPEAANQPVKSKNEN